MAKKKAVNDYENEAAMINGCLVHPNVARVSRKVYMMRHGNLPSHIFVCHTCDNGKCILDAHHFIGTQTDNMQDAAKKGIFSAAQRKRYEDPKEHEKQSKALKYYFKNTPGALEALKTCQKEAQNRPEVRTQRSAASILRMRNPAARAAISKALTGRSLTQERCVAISSGLLEWYKNPEACAENSRLQKIAQNKPGVSDRKRKALSVYYKTPEGIAQKHSRILLGWETRRKNAILRKGHK
jgi:hypothetical protein